MRKLYPEKYKSIKAMHKMRFGLAREKVIQRDGEACIMCGMTREEHRQRWNRDITVDHIDGNGRNSAWKNNDEDNLQTLCLPCHSRKDSARKRGE